MEDVAGMEAVECHHLLGTDGDCLWTIGQKVSAALLPALSVLH